MKTHVYTSGQDGYHTYRIPALLVTKAGTLLAFCEGRRNDRGDHGDLDLLVKRSEDGGETWSCEKLLHEGPAAYSCLTLLPDGDIGCLYEAGEEHAYQYLMFERFRI